MLPPGIVCPLSTPHQKVHLFNHLTNVSTALGAFLPSHPRLTIRGSAGAPRRSPKQPPLKPTVPSPRPIALQAPCPAWLSGTFQFSAWLRTLPHSLF